MIIIVIESKKILCVCVCEWERERETVRLYNFKQI